MPSLLDRLRAAAALRHFTQQQARGLDAESTGVGAHTIEDRARTPLLTITDDSGEPIFAYGLSVYGSSYEE